ncbi:MAG: hypothetical protein K5Q00_02365 [Gammaproteobacteria bacterium]|nr:hypothetical protein [Gammaproteobacteria bacterium]
MLFLTINIISILLPFALAVLHRKVNPRHVHLKRLMFGYFLFFNVFLKGVPIGIAAVFDGHKMATDNHWAYNPMISQYGIALISLGLLGLGGSFLRGGFRMAAAVGFASFSFLAAVLHITQLFEGLAPAVENVYVLIIFDLLTALILLYFCIDHKERNYKK